MNEHDDTAPADTQDVAERLTKPEKAKPSGPIEIEARITRMRDGATNAPALVWSGEPIKPGRKVFATLPNGVRYSGIIDECTEVDGENVATLKNGLTPAQK